MKLEISELSGANSALEKNNVQLRQELHQCKLINDENNNKNKLKYEELDAEYKQYKNNHDNELNRYTTEVASLKIMNQQKQDQLSKSDIKYNTDISIYKRKLDDAIKSYDEKLHNYEVALTQEKDNNLMLKKQISSLALENDQLKMTLENVNMYIDGLMNDDNSKIITMDTINTTTSAAAFSSASSSRLNTAETIEATEYPIDDTDELVKNFNQSYTGIFHRYQFSFQHYHHYQ
jgi:chromosome segregation ATPase